ncbi:CLUMA_CG008070, isoform A [Clunio marinus]|uniref:CLUMA_CG008070, isoform A n=1 Tax=Clunio marinus TaxID=568069 RepID=A0A1J1I841_9DIPT|nr:CLUMA_CG008070, isoform A [Clunio marinus]
MSCKSDSMRGMNDCQLITSSLANISVSEVTVVKSSEMFPNIPIINHACNINISSTMVESIKRLHNSQHPTLSSFQLFKNSQEINNGINPNVSNKVKFTSLPPIKSILDLPRSRS